MPEEIRLTDYVDEFADALRAQLEADEKRWGDTWRHRPRKGQEARMFVRFRDYFEQYIRGGVELPLLKIAGEVLICWVREHHPETLIQKGEQWRRSRSRTSPPT